jgi:dienelactone hydrolase
MIRSRGRSLGLCAGAGVVIAVIGFGSFGSSVGRSTRPPRSAPASRVIDSPRAPPFAVGKIVVRYTDPTRFVRYPGQSPQPRPIVTVIRYPAVGDPSGVDLRSAVPAMSSGPFPLIVFGHGFNVTPAIYARLLQAWVRAGYVVAAPIFPLSNANAPGGADESDIVNQPADMSFVITRMLAAGRAPHGILSRLLEPHEIAVSGQSDGGETALATAYDTHYLDPRVDAAVILSGAELPSRGFYFPASSPPLLASQGTADVINLPHNTYDFFHAASAPKFLLKLLGAPHLGPYTDEQPQLGVVEAVTVAFLDRYLKHLPGAGGRMRKDGDVRGIATLSNGP